MSLLKKMVVLFLLLLPIASAEIQLTKNIDSSYNIEDKLSFAISIVPDKTIQGFLGSVLNCDKYTLNYFTTPLSLVQNAKVDLTIPDLILTEDMLGKCSININIQDLNKNIIEKREVGNFLVSNNLDIEAFLNKQTFKPGDEVEVSGVVKNSRGDALDNVPITIIIDNKETKIANVNDKKFSLTFTLDNNIKSFEHTITLEAKQNVNSGKKTIQFYVAPVPARLKNSYEKFEFLPGETIEVESVLYDQANDPVDNNAQIKIYNPKNKLLIEGARKVILNLQSDALPGDYKVATKSDKLKIESKFKVRDLEKLDSSLDGKNLILKSTGNIPYKDEVRIIFNDDKSVSKNIKIKPNEIKTINLAREISKSGTYIVKLNTKYETKNLGEITLTREKGIGEKITSPVTGAVVSVRDSYGYTPFYGIIIAVIIAVMLIAYQKNKKTNIVRREADKREGERHLQNIKARRENPQEYRKRFNMDEKEVSDFRKQMLKNIAGEKAETKKQSFYSRDDEDEGYRAIKPKTGKGLFGMFD